MVGRVPRVSRKAVRGLLAVVLGLAIATGASALQLSSGGTLYLTVLDGFCPQRLDLWAVGPGRTPLHLGRFQGKVAPRASVPLGTYRPGQELYLWHETTDAATGARESVDIRNPQSYQVDLDPRGGYRIEIRAPSGDSPLLVCWVYPARPPAAMGRTGGSDGLGTRNGAAVGSMVVTPADGQDPTANGPARGPAPTQNRPGVTEGARADDSAARAPAPRVSGADQAVSARAVSPVPGTRWPIAEVLLGLLLVVTLRRTRDRLVTVHDSGTHPVSHKVAGQEHSEEAFDALGNLARRMPPSVERDELILRLADLCFKAGRPARAVEVLQTHELTHAHAASLRPLMSELERRGLSGTVRTPVPLAAPVQTPQPEPAPAATPAEAHAPEAAVEHLEAVAQVAAPVIVEAPAPTHAVVPCTVEAVGPAAAPAGAPASALAALPAPVEAAGPVALPVEVLASKPTIVPLRLETPPSMMAALFVNIEALPATVLERAAARARGEVAPAPSPLAEPHAPGAGPHPHHAARSGAGAVPARPVGLEPSGSVLLEIGERQPASRFLRVRPLGRVDVPAGSSHNGTVPSDPPSGRPMASKLLEQIVQKLASSYRDLVPIHSDGASCILSATDRVAGRKVAVHALSPLVAHDPRLVAMFLREGREHQELAQPGWLEIVSVVEGDVPHLVTQPLTGTLLSSQLVPGEGMLVHEAVAIGLRVSAVLDALHQKGRRHGDLRPSRIVGTYQRGYHILPPILGGAHGAKLRAACGDELERAGYEAPEVRTGKADYRADIWALGALLHEMVTGTRPAADPSRDPDLSRLAGGHVPEALTVIIGRCLKAQPDRRYQDCGVARQMLATLHQDYSSPQRVVLTCLAGLASISERGIRPLTPKLEVARALADDPPAFAHHFYTKANASLFRQVLAGPAGALRTIGSLVQLGQAAPAPLEPALAQILKEASSLGLSLEGLLKVVEDGGPRDEVTARRVLAETVSLADGLKHLHKGIEDLVAAHTIGFTALVQEARTRAPRGVSTASESIPEDLCVRVADPLKARRELGQVFDELFKNAVRAGARRLVFGGEYQDHGTRVRLVVSDDGRGVAEDVIRRLFVSDPAAGSASPEHGLERCRRILEGLGGRIFLANRSDAPGAEVRLSLPTHRPNRA